MVKLYFSFVKYCQFHSTARHLIFMSFNIHVRKIVWVILNFYVPSQKCIQVSKVTVKNNELWNVTKLNGDCIV